MQTNNVQNVANVPDDKNVFQARDIHTTVGWQWQAAAATRRIEQDLTGSKRLTALGIYAMLTILASEQRTPDRLHASYAYIAQRVGCSEDTARKYVRDEFAALRLVRVIARRHAANDFVLLACGPEPEAAKLQEPPSPTPHQGRGSHPATPAAPAWVASQPPNIRINDSKNNTNNKQNPVGGVATPVMLKSLPTDQGADGEAVRALTGLGVRRTVAEQMSATCLTDDIIAWSRYAQRQASLKSKAGFVLAMLRAGERPPSPFDSYVGQGYQSVGSVAITQQQPAAGLPAASAQAEPDSPVLSPQSSVLSPDHPLSTQHLALWLAACDELKQRLGAAAWGMWGSRVGLAGIEGGRATLSRPPVGVAAGYERRYGGDIEQVLTNVFDREMRVVWA